MWGAKSAAGSLGSVGLVCFCFVSLNPVVVGLGIFART